MLTPILFTFYYLESDHILPVYCIWNFVEVVNYK